MIHARHAGVALREKADSEEWAMRKNKIGAFLMKCTEKGCR